MRDDAPARRAPEPGDARPGGLAGGAPGNRMRAAAAATGVPAEASVAGTVGGRWAVIAGRAVGPGLGRAVAAGLTAMLGMALVWALLAGLLDVSWGLLFLAAIGGYVVALSVVAGAVGGTEQRPDIRVRVIAVLLAVAVWLLGTSGSYLVGLIILPGSTASLGERIANAPYVDSVVDQFALPDIAELALLGAVAWRSTHRAGR